MDTRPLRMLSGVEIVDRGRNVTDCILPEVGTKEVTPNESWLETKQIQTALEARKALVAVERIDKVGALSHAEWRDQLRLAEVTQQVGGHWQYLGHNVNGTFFLLPEEALYLIEINCLLLKHNQITVSLQKAYSLLLDNNMTLKQYKVYASLSRVGYKVFRHNKLKSSDLKMKSKDIAKMDTNDNENMKDSAKDCSPPAESTVQPHNGNNTISTNPDDNIQLTEMSVNPILSSDDTLNKEPTTVPQLLMIVANSIKSISTDNEKVMDTGPVLNDKVVPSIDEHGVIRLAAEEAADIEMETVLSSTATDSNTAKTDEVKNKSTDQNKQRNTLNIYQAMLQKIKNRKIHNSDPKSIQDRFKDIPDCFNKQILTIKVPNEAYLPRNVFLNNTSYVLNLKKLKNQRRKSTPPTVENRVMYRTIRNSSESEMAAVPTPELPQLLPNIPIYQQPFGYFPTWRPRFQPFNQRPHFPRHHFNQHPYFYRMMHYMPQNFANRPYMGQNYQHNRNQPNQRKRQRHNVKDSHLQAIKNFVNRLKHYPIPPNNSISSLSGLLTRFNEIYNERIRITPNFEIVNDNHDNVETIELDEADEVESKKPRLDSAKFDKYLASVKALAAKLKNLERKNQSVSKQKRAFSNLLKHFNETFDAEFHLDSKGTLIDKKLVVLDSSSDSDVVATDDIETKEKKRSLNSVNSEVTRNKKRKVINPFNVLKKVNEGAGTSQSAIENRMPNAPSENDFSDLSKYFDKNWLPNDDDFGKPELCSKIVARYLWHDSQQLFDFISWVDLNTWVDLKLAFCLQMEAVSDFEEDLNTHSRDFTMESSRLKPILSQESIDEWPASLEKLRIIKIDTEVQETSLRIDFDVYNRDVQNFRKTDPPKPHFRVVCLDESSKFPTGTEVRAVHARHDDNVTTVFAVVGTGSITYLQINPKDLPVYLGND